MSELTKTRIALALWVVLALCALIGCGGNNDDDQIHPEVNCQQTPEACK